VLISAAAGLRHDEVWSREEIEGRCRLLSLIKSCFGGSAHGGWSGKQGGPRDEQRPPDWALECLAFLRARLGGRMGGLVGRDSVIAHSQAAAAVMVRSARVCRWLLLALA
jgi:hypothetical protein